MTVVAGALAAHGYLAADKEQGFISLGCAFGMAVMGVAWSVGQKLWSSAEVQKALAAPVAGTYTLDDALNVVMPLVTQAITAALPAPVAAAPTVTAPPAAPIATTVSVGGTGAFIPPAIGGQ